MAKYIKSKDGKFAGSIGDGKSKVPTEAPAAHVIDVCVNCKQKIRETRKDTTYWVHDTTSLVQCNSSGSLLATPGRKASEVSSVDEAWDRYQTQDDTALEAEIIDEDEDEDLEEMGSDLAEIPSWRPSDSDSAWVHVQWERHMLPNGEKMIAGVADSPLLGIVYQPPGADFYKADLDTILPNGALSGDPLTAETFADQSPACRWIESEIRRREMEVKQFQRDYDFDPEGIRDLRRDAIRRLGGSWFAEDTSTARHRAAEFRYGDRVTTIAQDPDNSYTVIVGLTDGYDDFPEEVLHIRSFKKMAEAIDFAEEMTLLGDS